MTGILVIAMPIPIIVNNFARHYQRLKPVSKYWAEFQKRELNAVKKIHENVHGLYNIKTFEGRGLPKHYQSRPLAITHYGNGKPI